MTKFERTTKYTLDQELGPLIKCLETQAHERLKLQSELNDQETRFDKLSEQHNLVQRNKKKYKLLSQQNNNHFLSKQIQIHNLRGKLVFLIFQLLINHANFKFMVIR